MPWREGSPTRTSRRSHCSTGAKPLSGDDAAHFQELASGLRRTYRAEDAAEAGLVEAIAVATWQEITADRLEAEALMAIAGGDGKPFHGGLLLESPANRATLHTVLRY